MSKLRTLEALDDALSDETAWRKLELTTVRRMIEQSSGVTQAASLRSGVLVLYAHWEGWVKSVAQLYIRYVNTQKHAYSDLSAAFLGNALKVRIASIDDASTAVKHIEFASFLKEGMGDRAKISEDLVRTQSNLSSVVLLEIVNRLGLPERDVFLTRANMIDEELVNRRNAIAHGRYLELGVAEYASLHVDVLAILELFTDDIRNAASSRSYLAGSRGD